MTRPLYFTEGSRRLFGVYHAPLAERSSAQAVVMCPPAPQEYMTSHWALRRLAGQLANAGAHVLRFDYFGTGDSAGESDEGTLEIWQADVLAAADKLRELSRVQRVSFVGYRLGATLAWRASQTAPTKPRDLVLWDPVISGATYLRELRVADATFRVRLLHFPSPGEPPTELCGFVLPPAQYEATRAVNLLTEPEPAATRVHLVVGGEDEENRALSARLARDVRRFASVCIPEEQAKGSGNLLANRVLTAIVLALSPEAA
jgi:alpha/beta superfamily hydrolase